MGGGRRICVCRNERERERDKQKYSEQDRKYPRFLLMELHP